MRLHYLFFSMALGLSGSALAADKGLANLQVPSVGSPTQLTRTVTTSTSDLSVQDKTRQLAINSRKRKSQKQFEASIKRTYPQSYQMLAQLTETQRADVFSTYKAGESMSDVRRKVINLYSTSGK